MRDRANLLASGLILLTGFGVGGSLRAEEPKREAVEKLVAKFGSDLFEERNRAYRDLVLIGPSALPRLREAKKSEDIEVARRAANCVEEIERVWHYEFGEKELGLKELPDLLQATKDERPYVRASAASMLAKSNAKSYGEKHPFIAVRDWKNP